MGVSFRDVLNPSCRIDCCFYIIQVSFYRCGVLVEEIVGRGKGGDFVSAIVLVMLNVYT